MTSAVSLVASGSVRARVTVVQSARRTLIATVRPWRALRCRPSQSSLESVRRIVSSSSWEAMSSSKVRSVETDLAAPPSVSTGESSWKVARAFR